jgi:PKD repeat protein
VSARRRQRLREEPFEVALALGLAAVVMLAGCERGGWAVVEPSEAGGELDVIAEATPDEGSAPLEVRFVADVRDDGTGPWSQRWEFGDGDAATGAEATHVFTTGGRYMARLTVTDGDGRRGTDEVEVIVDDVE